MNLEICPAVNSSMHYHKDMKKSVSLIVLVDEDGGEEKKTHRIVGIVHVIVDRVDARSRAGVTASRTSIRSGRLCWGITNTISA